MPVGTSLSGGVDSSAIVAISSLLAGDHTVAVLSLHFKDRAPLATEQRDLLDSFVRQIALVLDRQRLRDAEQQAKLVSESERLSKTLLNSVSHEIRTPLAAISNAAGNLGEAQRGALNEFQQTMVDEIQEASKRLNRLVGNLLNMTRVESGHVKPKLDWCDVADLIQATLKEIERDMSRHGVTLTLAQDLPLVRMDFVLMQQVLTNLLLNVAAHTPPGTPVNIDARVDSGSLALAVSDQGPGLPPETQRQHRARRLWPRLGPGDDLRASFTARPPLPRVGLGSAWRLSKALLKPKADRFKQKTSRAEEFALPFARQSPNLHRSQRKKSYERKSSGETHRVGHRR